MDFLCRTYLDLDITKDYIPVNPAVHYFMGGLFVDKNHKTTIENLFAAGECAHLYHGANRLGGNSTLGAIYGGFVAGRNASACQENEGAGTVEEGFDFDKRIAGIISGCMRIERDEDTLKRGLEDIRLLQQTPATLLGEAMIRSAIQRTESRGAHRRSDHPETNEEFECIMIARNVANGILVEKASKNRGVSW